MRQILKEMPTVFSRATEIVQKKVKVREKMSIFNGTQIVEKIVLHDSHLIRRPHVLAAAKEFTFHLS
jgi:hypothetical protein